MMVKMPATKKILVIRMGALGDLVHLSGTLDTVCCDYEALTGTSSSGLEIHVLTRAGFTMLTKHFPSVSRTWTWNPKGGLGELLKTGLFLRQFDFDGVINLHPSLKTALLCTLIGAHSVTYKKQKLREKGEAQRSISRRHAIEDFYQPFQQLLGISKTIQPVEPPRLTYPLPNDVVEPFSLASNALHIGIIPGVGGKRANRAWPVEHWVTLINALPNQLASQLLLNDETLHPTIQISLFGGADERALAEEILSKILTNPLMTIQNYCGECDIHGTSALLRQCDVVIGGDTGPTHLTAGLNVPLVQIFGPTSVDRTGARGENTILTATPPDSLTCWPCELPNCPLTGDQHLACVRDITPDAVLKLVSEQINKAT